MKRRVLGMALIVALVAIIAVGATLAYFTDTTQAVKNTFTMGNVDIKLYETAIAAASSAGTTTEEGNTYTGVMPGVKMDKDPTVENVGPNDAWIRVNVTVTKAAAWKAALGVHGITDLTEIFGGFDATKWTRTTNATPTINADGTVTYSYYLNAPLAAGAKETLFTSVTVPAVFTNDELAAIDGFEISITADAIQYDGFETAAAAFVEFDAVPSEDRD